MIRHTEISGPELHKQIRQNLICYGGNSKLKIYGLITCRSGKRMNKINRVFFTSLKDALENEYRPCGNCMKTDYIKWKNESL